MARRRAAHGSAGWGGAAGGRADAIAINATHQSGVVVRTGYNAAVTETPGAPPPQLDRRLGPIDAAAIVISNVIGVGIFTSPGIIAQIVPHPGGMLTVWLAGGLLAFAGAMAYAELAALRPRSGGEYVYLRAAYGPLAGFLTGWTSFIAGFTGAIAAGAIGVADYLGRFVPAAGSTTPLLSVPLGVVTLTLTPRAIVAIVAIAALAAVHVRGIGPGRIVQNLLAGTKVAALLLFVALGLTLGRGTWAGAASGEGVAASSWLLALVPVMFSYSGWNAAAYVAEEVKDPGRNVPRALALGTAAVIVLYLGVNLLYLYALPVNEIAALNAQGQIAIADAAARRLLGATAADLLGAATIVILLGSLSAMILAGPRVYYAMAQDGTFFPAAARVHPRFRTPATSIVAQAAWSCVLVLSGTFNQLLTYTGFAVVLFSGLAVSAVFVLRWRNPAEPRPFRALGYPLGPGVFALASLVIVVNAIMREPGPSAWGILLMASGIPLYWGLSRTRRGAGRR
jgi:APA family basic amino acid/polyamine antiporter